MEFSSIYEVLITDYKWGKASVVLHIGADIVAITVNQSAEMAQI